MLDDLLEDLERVVAGGEVVFGFTDHGAQPIARGDLVGAEVGACPYGLAGT